MKDLKLLFKIGLLVLPMVLPMVLTGCAGALRNYDKELLETTQAVRVNNPAQALRTLEQNNTDKDKDLLYFMEKGGLLRMTREFSDSRASWMEADRKVQEWEDLARTNPDKLLGDIGSVLVNDKTRVYEGEDYEKVLLTTRIALAHISLGDWDAARTEIKKTHERESIIAELHVKKVLQEEEESEKRNISRDTKELQGYPIETLNDPEVIALKNSYQNAFSHYLAGFVYEALNEPGLAAPGYRQAIELRPDVPFLEGGLKQLERRSARLASGKTDVLFVVEGGMAPTRSSVMIPLPIPTVGVVSISFPVIPANPSAAYAPGALLLNGTTSVDMAAVTNVDAMARRALRDNMPSILLRSTIRAVTKGVAQQQANQRGNQLLGLMVMLGGLVMESADERTWRTLPANIHLGRATLAPGTYSLSFKTASGSRAIATVEVAGQYQVVPIRVVDDAVYLASTPDSSYGELAPPSEEKARSKGNAKRAKGTNKKKAADK